MKRILKSFVFKFGENLAALALMVTVLNVNAACFWYCHQPELPEVAKRLRKF